MATSLEDQLRALRAANVYRVEFHEDGGLKSAEFFPPLASEGPANGATPASPHPERPPKPEIDLLADVIMQPDKQVQLTEEDFPPEAIDYGADDLESEQAQ